MRKGRGALPVDGATGLLSDGRLIAKVAETLPDQKKHALTLLDRALSTEPEDGESRKLRESLKAK